MRSFAGPAQGGPADAAAEVHIVHNGKNHFEWFRLTPPGGQHQELRSAAPAPAPARQQLSAVEWPTPAAAGTARRRQQRQLQPAAAKRPTLAAASISPAAQPPPASPPGTTQRQQGQRQQVWPSVSRGCQLQCLQVVADYLTAADPSPIMCAVYQCVSLPCNMQAEPPPAAAWCLT